MAAKILKTVPKGAEVLDFDEVDLSREVLWLRIKQRSKVSRVCVKLRAGVPE